jgi:hypothetical protein
LGSLQGGPSKKLLANTSYAVYVEPGYLIFNRGTVLMAQPFDGRNLEFTGEATSVVDDVPGSGFGDHPISVSNNGVLAFVAKEVSQLQWRDRTGRVVGTFNQPAAGEYANPRLSPDRSKIAVNRFDSRSGESDIWFCRLMERRGPVSVHQLLAIWIRYGLRMAVA